MLTDIWFTAGYAFANFWFSPGLGWRGPGRSPLPKNKSRAPPPPRGVWVYILSHVTVFIYPQLSSTDLSRKTHLHESRHIYTLWAIYRYIHVHKYIEGLDFQN